MHKEVLTKEQVEFLPLVKLFYNDFGLVGGTAVALHIGHRRSVDFDLFTDDKFNNLTIRRKIKKNTKIDGVIVDRLDEFTFVAKGVKFTFFCFPYKINYSKRLDNIIKLPDLLTLAAMKAFSLSRRAKWKDYVDLYFVIRDYYSVEEIIKKANQVFSTEFNEKIFRAQLAYSKDIDYTEKVIYMKGFKTDDEIVKKNLIKFILS